MIMIESGNQSIDLFKKERVNKELAIEKKLIINDDSKIYTSVQKLYIKCFEQILLSKVDLKKYEERIENSKCNIGPVKVKNKTYYHNLSSMNLKFIYIRNFFYVEKLNENDLSIMIQKVNNNNYEVDNALMDIVNRTYKDVLANNYVNGEYYAGSYKNNLRSGQGTAHFPNGDIYIGQWDKDSMNGKGTYYFGGKNSKTYYEGEMSKNEMTGKGTYWNNGTAITGTFIQNRHVHW